MSLRHFLKDVALPGTIEFEHKVHPFKPSSAFPKFAEDNFLKYKKKQREKLLKQQYLDSRVRSKIRSVVDAETGERLTLTKSVWSSEEGQLGNDIKTIMARGTGQLNIFRSERDDQKQEEESRVMQTHVPSEVFTKFMEEGPLNEYAQAGWSPEKKIIERKRQQHAAGDRNRSPARRENKNHRKAPLRLETFSYEKTRQSASNSAYASTVFESDPGAEHYAGLTVEVSVSDVLELRQEAVGDMDNADPVLSTAGRSDDGSTVTNSDCPNIIADDGEVVHFDFPKVEQQLYRELLKAALYMNSQRPEGVRRSREDIEKSSRDIAHTKAVGYRDVFNAVNDERARDQKRAADMLVLTDEKDKKQMRSKHAAERRKAQNYIKQLQYDSEVLLIRKMKAEKYLW